MQYSFARRKKITPSNMLSSFANVPLPNNLNIPPCTHVYCHIYIHIEMALKCLRVANLKDMIYIYIYIYLFPVTIRMTWWNLRFSQHFFPSHFADRRRTESFGRLAEAALYGAPVAPQREWAAGADGSPWHRPVKHSPWLRKCNQ